MTNVHYRKVWLAHTACEQTDPSLAGTTEWSAVTCGTCKLEQPMQDVPGRVTYRIPDHIVKLDLEAALEDAIARRERAAWDLSDAGKKFAEATQHERGIRQALGDVLVRLNSASSTLAGHDFEAQPFSRLCAFEGCGRTPGDPVHV